MPRTLAALVLVALAPGATHAAGPVCALLDPEKNPRAALLEAKLLADPVATWVERNQIAKVLAEQRLQALFSPQGVGERVKLGKLLKADVLVMVRSVKGAAEPALEVVVCETGGGLRLLVRAVPVTDSADVDVTALLAAVRDGVKRHGEKVTEVVAVPPFVSQDLGHQHGYLKAAYARVLEGAALARPGVLVVELDEAEALAKEIALTAPGTAPARPPAVYLMGEYRHAGVGQERTVTLRLRAERGGKPVGEAVTKTAKPDEAAAGLRAWAADVLKVAGPAGPADPKGEAKLLAARAREFRRLGFRAEALDLLEAAALTDPADPEWHLEALFAVRLLLKQRLWSVVRPLDARFESGLPLHRRGLEHLEAFVFKGGRPGGATPRERTRTESRIVGTVLDHLGYTERRSYRPDFDRPFPPNYPPQQREKVLAERAEWRKRFDPVQAEQRELLFRIIPLVMKWERAEHGAGHYTEVRSLPSTTPVEAVLLDAALFHLPLAERMVITEKFLLGIKDAPDAEGRVTGHLAILWHRADRGPVFDDLLKRLDATGHDKIRAAIKLTRSYMQFWHRYTAEQKAAVVPSSVEKPTPTAPPPDPKLVTFAPVVLATADGPLAAPVADLVPAGPGIDVLSAGSELFVIKEKGKLQRVWAGAEKERPRLAFDGRYVWASVVTSGPGTRLFVLDPVTEKVHPVAAEHGLPDGGNGPQLATLTPGHACLAGTVPARGGGIKQAWIALATFDPKAGPAVTVIHEAKIAPDAAGGDWKAPDVVFTPKELVTCRRWPPGKGSELRVLLPRTSGDPVASQSTLYDPLLIDPDRGAVTVLSKDVGARTWVPVGYPLGPDGSLYEVTRGSVWRATPDGRREELAAGALSGAALSDHAVSACDGRLHIFGTRPSWAKSSGVRPQPGQTEWWEFDPATGAARYLAGGLPGQPALVVSGHYGPVLIGHKAGKTGDRFKPTDPSNVYAVALPPPAKAAPPAPAPEAVTFKPVAPTVKSGERAMFSTLVAVGPGVDVLGGSGGRVYVMKEKGVAKQVWAEEGSRTLLAFDGRYVWVSVERGEKEPGLFVLDPATEKVYPVTAEHKLPGYTPAKPTERPFRPTIRAAPIGPGRVLLAGTLTGVGNGGWWLAAASFDPVKGPTVQGISKGPLHVGALEPVARRTPDGKTEVRVRFDRDHKTGSDDGGWLEPRYFLDPERLTIEKMYTRDAREWVPLDVPVTDGGVRYELHLTERGAMITPEGYRRAVVHVLASPGPLTGVGPDGERSEVAGLPQYDRFYRNRVTLYHNGRLLISDGYYWGAKRTAADPLAAAHWRFGLWEFDPATEEVRQLSAAAPSAAKLAVSAHYGIVAIAGGGLPGQYDALGSTAPRMYAIERTEPVAEK